MEPELIQHNENLISIRVSGPVIDIAKREWDVCFKFFNTIEEAYFIASKPYDYDNRLNDSLRYNLNELSHAVGSSQIFGRINLSNLLINRTNLSRLWKYYEYPAILLAKHKVDTHLLELLYQEERPFSDFVDHLHDVVILYQSFEPNVLWVQKDSSSVFPFLSGESNG